MTDHRRWLELVASAPAFSPAAADADGLAAHLASCTTCSQRATGLRSDLAAVNAVRDRGLHEDLRERIRGATLAEPGFNPVLVVAILGLLLAAVLGATLTVGGAMLGRDDPLPAPAALPDISGKAIVWETPVVHLGADRVEMRANGRTFSAATKVVKVGGDPGGLDRWTLEVAWPDSGVQSVINAYFKSDGATWWIDEVRTSNAGPAGKWATFPRGRLAVTPLGQSFRGDLTASGVGSLGPVELVIRGMVLSVTPQPAFVAPPGGGQPLARDPFAAGGVLHCSGILQLTPQQAERQLRQFRLSWRWQYKTGPNQGFAEIRLAAPAVGVISGTAIGSNGELIVFVEDPTRPSMAAATFPADCPVPPGP